jgi:hypothetical protein
VSLASTVRHGSFAVASNLEKPWLTQRQTDLFSLWIKAASVIVSVGVLALLAALAGLWLVTP